MMFRNLRYPVLVSALILLAQIGYSSESTRFAGGYSDFEGNLVEAHDHELQRLKEKYLINEDGTLNPTKIQGLIQTFEKKRPLIADSIYLSRKMWLINSRGFTEEAATKSALKDREVIIAFDAVIDQAKALLAHSGEMTSEQIRDQVATLALIISSCDTLEIKNLFSNDQRMLGNILRWEHKVSKDESKAILPSNLTRDGQFISAEEAKNLMRNGVDLSTLDPPSSAFWKNNKVEDYDPYNETVMGVQDLFPREGTPFTYRRMGSGTIKMKLDWLDNKASKHGLMVRFGKEAHTSVLTAHLAHAVGFGAIPQTFRKKIKILLGDITYDQFIAEWANAHEHKEGTPVTYVEKYIPEENAVIMKEATLEAYPDEDKRYVKVGMFLSGRNGMSNRREYRAQLMYSALINLADTNDIQTRMDFYRETEQDPWKPLFFISDTGFSMGSYVALAAMGAVNEYSESVTKNAGDHVNVIWNHLGFKQNMFKNVTYSDARWIIRRFARLSDDQILNICRAAGYAEPVAMLYAEKIKRRINNMVEDFGLAKDGVKPIKTREYSEIATQFPEYVTQSGKLKVEAESMPGNVTPLLGFYPTIYEMAQISAITNLQNGLLNLLSLRPNLFGLGDTVSIGGVDLGFGPKIGGSRTIQKNPEIGGPNKRFLVKDSYTVSMPVGVFGDPRTSGGLSFQTPISVTYTYTYNYYHSYATLKEASYVKFFNNLNPWSILSIRKNLAPGEALHVVQTTGMSLGNFEVKAGGAIDVKVTPFGFQTVNLKEMYVSKTSDNFMEMLVGKTSEQDLFSGLELESFIRASMSTDQKRYIKDYKLYRFKTDGWNDVDSIKLQTAYKDALYHNDFKGADKLAIVYHRTDHEVKTDKKFGLFLNTMADGNSANEIDVQLYDQDFGTKTTAEGAVFTEPKKAHDYFVLTAGNYHDNKKNFANFWVSRLTFGLVKTPLNYFGKAVDEETHRGIWLEGYANESQTGFEDVNLSISVEKFDNYCHREEFQHDFMDYFNHRSGPKWTRKTPNDSDILLDFKMPDTIKAYSPIMAKMSWQLSKGALAKLLAALKDESNIRELSYNQPIPFWMKRSDFDRRYSNAVHSLIQKIEAPMTADMETSVKRAMLKEKARATVELIRALIGPDSRSLGWIRKWVPDNELWLTLGITNPLFSEVPMSGADFFKMFAPEVGKFQGQGILRQLQLHYQQVPNMYWGDTFPFGIFQEGGHSIANTASFSS